MAVNAKQIVPATRFAPEFCRSLQPVARIEPSEIRERMSGFNAPRGFTAFNPGYELRKGSGTPTSAWVMKPCLRARRRIRRDALACRRSTAVLTRGLSPLSLSFRPGFLGRGRSALSGKPAPTGERRRCASKRALPAPACPSPGNAPPAPAVVPASMMPEAARERIASSARGHRTRSVFGLPSQSRPLHERDCRM